MIYDNDTKEIIFNSKEIDIICLGIMELEGPFHSPFAKHLFKFHHKDLFNIKDLLEKNKHIKIENCLLIIDVLQVFIIEPLKNDWGNLYEDIEKRDVGDILIDIQKIYFDVTGEKYDGRYNKEIL